MSHLAARARGLRVIAQGLVGSAEAQQDRAELPLDIPSEPAVAGQGIVRERGAEPPFRLREVAAVLLDESQAEASASEVGVDGQPFNGAADDRLVSRFNALSEEARCRSSDRDSEE